MQHDDEPKTLDELLDAGDTMMVGTPIVGGTVDFRPLTVARVRGDEIQMLVDSTADWARRFDEGDDVLITVSDDRDNNWLSLHGPGRLSTSAHLIDELWNPMASAYFDNGRETPGIAAFTVRVEHGRYWTSPSGRIGSLISAVRAKIGHADQSGEHGTIALETEG